MARLIHSPTGSGPVNAFEALVVSTFLNSLPAGYLVVPNFSVKEPRGDTFEYDVVVLAPHAIYVVEAKEWYGRISGDDGEWMLNQTPRKCPLWLADHKCKVLKSKLGAVATRVWFSPVFVCPDQTQLFLRGNWAEHAAVLKRSVGLLQNKALLKHPSDVAPLHEGIVRQLQGAWAARQQQAGRRIAGYEVTETLQATDDGGEYLARRALVPDKTPYRVRTWRLSPYSGPTEREQQLLVIRRPTEALARIGRHPNLLQILDFNELPEENLFFEATEWSDHGTLHGYLANSARDRLTLRERVSIAAGVANALAAVHEQKLVHRNVCPDTILIGADRQPRLTDFDRSFIPDTKTVYAATESRRGNLAYLAPELRDSTQYATDPGADMYSLGVLLYHLLTDVVPFPDPLAAIKAGGVPAKLPSQYREGVPAKLDDLVRRLLNVSDPKARPNPESVLAVLREFLGSSAEPKPGPPSTASTAAHADKGYATNDVIDGQYRVLAVLGRGSYSRVYKVLNLDQNRIYAMKILSRPDDADLILNEYNAVGRYLPVHPYLMKIEWLGRLSPPLSLPFVLSEFVDGEPLTDYCDGKKTLAWADIRQIGMKLLEGLEAIHPKPGGAGDGFLHRDIKPANVVLQLPSHDPKLIDFNLAAKAADATGYAGTPRYWAPDRGRPEWRPDADLFSLGVVLYELVMHQHPFPSNNPTAGDPVDPREVDADISPALAEFLLKAVHPASAGRFQTAADMRAALAEVTAMRTPAPSPSSATAYRGLTLLPSEVGRPDYNPYVTRLRTLYSQSRVSNAGTRGLDDIARLTYVETLLDEHLVPAIVAGEYRLVIVTGNAGDGKTAFLQQVEEHVRRLGTAVTPLPTQNGSTWTSHGLTYRTNYDGSQDEGETTNQAVLEEFFEPFAGSPVGGMGGDEVRLVAINEGRLLDFLLHGDSAAKLPGLRAVVPNALAGAATGHPRLLVVNLNLRAVTAGGRNSLVEKQLGAMLRDDVWAPCDGCSLKHRCPIRHNAESLRDRASGLPVRDRVRRLYEIVHLRRMQHLTMRDLRSSLSWLLLRDQDCAEVAKVLADSGPGAAERLSRLYYPNAFAGDEPPAAGGVDDRLVKLLRQIDVGLVDSPATDAALDRDPSAAVPWMTFESRDTGDQPGYARHVTFRWAQQQPRPGENFELPELFRRRRHAIARLRRWAFFERRDEGWREMIPYQSVHLLENLLAAPDAATRAAALEKLKDQVLEAMTLAEGLRERSISKDYLALRISRVRQPSVRSFRLFDRRLFHVEVSEIGTLGRYLEYEPDSIELVAASDGCTARLRLTIDLLEMLSLIRGGYRPSPADLQGRFVNLLIFRNELLNLPFERVLLTPDDESYYEVAAAAAKDTGIRLAITRRRTAGAGQEANT